MKHTFIVFLFSCLSINTLAENYPVKMVINYQLKGTIIPSDYLGLSYETSVIKPNKNGTYYFAPSNSKLIKLFKTLNIKSLRLGGSSVDHSNNIAPTNRDIDSLFAFARQAGVKIIYSVRLHNGTTSEASRIAKHIYKNYADLLEYFSIGNEPGYYKDYEHDLQPRWDSIMKAMRAVAPKAKFCAPDDNPNPILCEKMIRDYGSNNGNPLSLITIHSYPAGCAYINPGNPKGIEGLIPYDYHERSEYLLSDELPLEYAKIYNQMEPIISNFPFRLSETNNYWYSGLDGASNSFASALWALDYMYWWASRGSLGVNFHTGDHVGGTDMVAHYSSFFTEGDSMHINPLSYAIKAFSIGGFCKLVPVTISPASQISAYAKCNDRGFVYVTVINKEHGAKAKPREIELSIADNIKNIYSADYVLMQTPKGDILNKDSVTLAESRISGKGDFSINQWHKALIDSSKVRLVIPPTTAVILKICTGQYHIVNSSVEPMQYGKYKPEWGSLKKYEVPEWFRNAKFGIWAHWGPQSVPEYGDWYAYYMYKQGSRENKYHLQHYGHPSQIGFKDLIHQWTAEHFDPSRLIKLYKRAGAQYFVTLANHHDNFDLWDSQYHPWNSTKEGPHRNIVAEWAAATRKEGLHFGVSVHSSRAWSWYDNTEGSDASGEFKGVPYDGILTKADGYGKWWDGKDPQILYARHHALNDTGFTDKDGRPTAIPDSSYVENYYERTLDVINKYHPDLVYFDDSHLPLWPASDVGLKIAAHYYNSSLLWNKGNQEGVITAKELTPNEQDCLVWDVERGALSKINDKPWQTCTCLGSWHYDRTRFTKNTYKTAQRVIRMLADIVSKNGNLLLSVPIRADGTLDEREESILDSISKWMDVNRECIFDTHPWQIYGEGPDMKAARQMTGVGFNESNGIYTSQDFRFTQKGNNVYVIMLNGKDAKKIEILSFAGMQKRIKSVEMLGLGKVHYDCDESSLRFVIPHPSLIPVFKITMK